MKIKKLKIKDLISPEWNPRQITELEMQKLQDSIQEFGYVDPIIVNTVNNHIVGGNQRYTALQALGYKEVDCILIEEPDIEREKALNVSLNNISGEWDKTRLTDIFKEFDLNGFDLKLTSFDNLQIEELDLDIDLTSLENSFYENNTDNETEEEKEAKEYSFNDKEDTVKEYQPKTVFKLLLTFENEKQQKNYYEKCLVEGIECRLLTL